MLTIHGCVRWMLITASTRISDSDCYLAKMVLFSDGVGAADGKVYNGIDTNGELRIPAICPTEGRVNLNFSPPMRMDKGIYAEVGSNVGGMLLGYISAREMP